MNEYKVAIRYISLRLYFEIEILAKPFSDPFQCTHTKEFNFVPQSVFQSFFFFSLQCKTVKQLT